MNTWKILIGWKGDIQVLSLAGVNSVFSPQANKKKASGVIKSVNESYFGSYNRFSIHGEMLSDQVRMHAYKGAILNNPSLFK